MFDSQQPLNLDLPRLDDDPLWYKDAIIYELHVRAFSDSNDDGIGDFHGLIKNLDYLQDLGITAIWLLPFYPSPLKDDGYDIADYTDILPDYGDMQAFRTFIQEAHRRGLRVITELVMNHTSDQHPWFQRARRARSGSDAREFYVWSDTPEKYKEARIIFKDFECSNWTWDPIAGAYYWHRFYSHQPDLNYDNPLVRKAILRIVDFWLRLGVDGLRIDALPYLYEREGTNCENLPETHVFVSELRQQVDAKFRNRLLLAEANQWPEDAVAYFGNGTECHMAFHFPLMPRLFMAVRMEDRFPIVDIVQETPNVPDNCQWALFLRNHDELTLEMVTDEERDYMYRVYAGDPNMRVNMGIRRRLAPLLSNDRRKIELMNALLFSLPGTPVIYYGDEIGMGDNFYLGDRNGVRTPMQWSADRNAGFSRANPQSLYLPIIIDPEYHYEAINVEAQSNNPDSLLWWMKRTIELRKRFDVFGRGSLEFLQPTNRKVLAFLRHLDGKSILVVANLSRTAQHAHLDLGRFRGRIPVELYGGTEFAHIGESPYYITLSPYGFYWFSLELQSAPSLLPTDRSYESAAPLPEIIGKGEEIFEEENRGTLEELLLRYARQQGWVQGRRREIQSSDIEDIVSMRLAGLKARLIILRVTYTEGEPETFAFPLAYAGSREMGRIVQDNPGAAVAQFKRESDDGSGQGVLYDALADKRFCTALLGAIGRHRRFRGEIGEVLASTGRAFDKIRGPARDYLEPGPLKSQRRGTTVVYGNRLILKFLRRLEEGANPDLEIGHFLNEKVLFPSVAPVAGSLEYRRRNREPMNLALLQGFVANQGDAWHYTLDNLKRYFEHVLAHPTSGAPPSDKKGLFPPTDEPPKVAQETIGPYFSAVHSLGEVTARLHVALASHLDDPEFAPEPFTAMYQNSIYHAMRSSTIDAIERLRQQAAILPENVARDAHAVLSLEGAMLQRFEEIRRQKIKASRIHCHGDFHLGHVLHTGKEFVIIDFAGDQANPLSERWVKRCPLRDVATMIRSFYYAAQAALLQQASSAAWAKVNPPVLEQWAQLWCLWVSRTFLKGYLPIIEQTGLLPRDPAQSKILLELYLLERTIQELDYELENGHEWLTVPLLGILWLMGSAE